MYEATGQQHQASMGQNPWRFRSSAGEPLRLEAKVHLPSPSWRQSATGPCILCQHAGRVSLVFTSSNRKSSSSSCGLLPWRAQTSKRLEAPIPPKTSSSVPGGRVTSSSSLPRAARATPGPGLGTPSSLCVSVSGCQLLSLFGPLPLEALSSTKTRWSCQELLHEISMSVLGPEDANLADSKLRLPQAAHAQRKTTEAEPRCDTHRISQAHSPPSPPTPSRARRSPARGTPVVQGRLLRETYARYSELRDIMHHGK